MRAYLGYALSGAGIVAMLAGLLSLALGPAMAKSVWWGGTLAYGVQLIAFSVLLWLRRRQRAFLAAWTAGIVARLAVVLLAAWWVSRSEVLEPAPALLSLAGFLFVLLLLEPVFFFVGRREG